jgi:cystathionine beta-lyase/cystathionine gamma-synthase
VERVHYPGLPAHPQHALARAQMEDFGTIVTVDVKGGLAAAKRFAGALQLFAFTPSLGSVESLVVTSSLMKGRDLTSEQQQIAAVADGTVRLSIGLEDPEDLLEDLEQALAAA